MKKRKFPLPIQTMALFAAAFVLLAFSAVGGTRAALNAISDVYQAQLSLHNIGVSLLENGTAVDTDDGTANTDGSYSDTQDGVLLGSMLAEGETLQLGKHYTEQLTVRNEGMIDQYVRVVLYQYWTDSEGNKLQTLDPDFIQLNLVNTDRWVEDTNASTKERRVFYYRQPLAGTDTASDEATRTTVPLCDALSISSKAAVKVSETTDGNTVTSTYVYNGCQLALRAEVDAVQTHQAADAILSAWGVTVTTAADGSLQIQ